MKSGPTTQNPLRKTKSDGIAYIPERATAKPDGELMLLSLPSNKKLATIKLDGAPVFDGLIAAKNRVYLSTQDGKIICIGKK